MQNIRTHKTP